MFNFLLYYVLRVILVCATNLLFMFMIVRYWHQIFRACIHTSYSSIWIRASCLNRKLFLSWFMIVY